VFSNIQGLGERRCGPLSGAEPITTTQCSTKHKELKNRNICNKVTCELHIPIKSGAFLIDVIVRCLFTVQTQHLHLGYLQTALPYHVKNLTHVRQAIWFDKAKRPRQHSNGDNIRINANKKNYIKLVSINCTDLMLIIIQMENCFLLI